MEAWRPVPEWEGLYEVSSHGRVRSVDRNVHYADGRLRTFWGKVRKLHLDSFGYPKVTLKVQGLERRVLVHQIVCTAWHGPAPEGHEVRHLDGVPANCHKDNLAWGTSAENTADSRRHGTHRRARKLSDAAIKDIRAQRGKLTGAQLAAKHGTSRAHVCNIQLHNRRKD